MAASNTHRHTAQFPTLASSILLLSLLLLLLLPYPVTSTSQCWDAFSKEDFPRCQQLDTTYALHWRIQNGTITFAVSISPAPKWFGLGLSEAGGMKGADIMLVQTPANDTAPWTVTDMFSIDYARPTPDKQQDVLLLNGTLTNNTLKAVFFRPLTTCDNEADWPIAMDNTVQHVIWSMSNSTEFKYHGTSNRGKAMVVFDPDPAATLATDPSDTTTFDIFMPNYTARSNTTTDYRCVVAKLPTGPKRHMFRFKTTVNSSLLHHMILYGCSKAPPNAGDTTFDCSSMPVNCQTFLVSWAPGAADFAFPPDAAFAVGGKGISWFALQAHYNNPKQLATAPDASGFTLYLTQQLRKYDAAILWLGSEQIEIPGGAPNYSPGPNVCPFNCTKQLNSSLTVINTFPHMHQIGRSLVTRHIRDGKELPPLSERRYWDFNFQQKVTVPLGTKIMPGDTLITTCTYDASDRSKKTSYGEESTDEMCYNFVLYYPAVPSFEQCMSVQALQYELGVCATRDELTQGISSEAQALQYFNEGKLVLFSRDNFTAYDPTCQASADPSALQAITASGGAAAPGMASNGSLSTASPSPALRGSSAPPSSTCQYTTLWMAALLSMLVLLWGPAAAPLC